MSSLELRTLESGREFEILKHGNSMLHLRVFRPLDGAVVSFEESNGQAMISIAKTPGASDECGVFVTGQVGLQDAVPCFIGQDIPDQHCLHLTSGITFTSFFTGFYSPIDDLAVTLESEARLVTSGDVAIAFAIRDPDRVTITLSLNHFRRNINQFYEPIDRERFPRPPVGWLSWYCYFCDFDETKTLATTDFAVKHFMPYGFEYVQLETWERNSDALPVCLYYNSLEWDEKKFPHGMKWISDQIHERGLKSGLWIVPLGTGEEKDYLENKELFLQNDEGGPVESWSGLYSLDPTHPKTKERVFETLRTVVKDWGYDYVKVDGLELGGTYGDRMFTLPEVVRHFHTQEPEPLRDVGEIVREAIGDDTFFLACLGNPRKEGKFYGLANGARIGHDVFYEGEDIDWAPVVKVAKAIQRSLHVHNIAWFNDPDVLCVRSALPDNMATILMTMYGIAGQLLFLGDILYEIPEDRVKKLTRLMPVDNVFPGQIPSIDPDASPASSPAPWATEQLKEIWALHIGRTFEQWNVVALFNWDESKSKSVKLTMAGLGLDERKSYLLYDFWNDKFLGTMSADKSFRLPKQSCLLLGIREKQRHPQILSTNRHITMGGVDLVDVQWDKESSTLSGESDVIGGDDYVISLRVPGGFLLDSVTSTPGNVSYDVVEKDVAKVTIKTTENTRVEWHLQFKKKAKQA